MAFDRSEIKGLPTYLLTYLAVNKIIY